MAEYDPILESEIEYQERVLWRRIHLPTNWEEIVEDDREAREMAARAAILGRMPPTLSGSLRRAVRVTAIDLALVELRARESAAAAAAERARANERVGAALGSDSGSEEGEGDDGGRQEGDREQDAIREMRGERTRRESAPSPEEGRFG